MQWNHEFTKRVGVNYPIVQAPMLGVTTPEMVAAVSNAGGLGSLPVGGLSPEKTRTLIQQTKALTDKPFAVNFFANSIPHFDCDEADAMQEFLEKLCAEWQIPFQRQDISEFRFYSYEDQVPVLLEEATTLVSFTFGIPDGASIRTLKEKGALLIGTATSVKEASLLKENNIDMIAAQGIEAGGHRGSFLEEGPLPLVGTMTLVPEIVRHTGLPVLAAGGIRDGKTIRAAFALGAVAVQVGTAFIASEESVAIPSYRAALQVAADTDAVLTRAFTGRWARGIGNKLMEAVEQSGLPIPPYPIQNSLTMQLREAARKKDNKEFVNLWAGQSAFGTETGPSAAIFRRLVQEVEAEV
ncbi:MAG TPA: nitronate monooxygenase [Puia sp.]|nr:nitronate monooxygenase [Puia sp.]